VAVYQYIQSERYILLFIDPTILSQWWLSSLRDYGTLQPGHVQQNRTKLKLSALAPRVLFLNMYLYFLSSTPVQSSLIHPISMFPPPALLCRKESAQVLYGIRAPIIDPFRAWKSPFGCLELIRHGIRVLAEQHSDKDSTNERKPWIFLDQWEWRRLEPDDRSVRREEGREVFLTWLGPGWS